MKSYFFTVWFRFSFFFLFFSAVGVVILFLWIFLLLLNVEEFGGRLLFPQHKHILHIWQMMTIHIAKKPKKEESKELNSIIFFHLWCL